MESVRVRLRLGRQLPGRADGSTWWRMFLLPAEERTASNPKSLRRRQDEERLRSGEPNLRGSLKCLDRGSEGSPVANVPQHRGHLCAGTHSPAKNGNG